MKEMKPGLRPGAELDATVAEKVMGWTVCKEFPQQLSRSFWVDSAGNRTTWRDTTPPYSTDIRAAWEVVEKLKYPDGDFYFNLGYDNNGIWDACFYLVEGEYYPDRKWSCALAAPHAICLAALKAVGVV